MKQERRDESEAIRSAQTVCFVRALGNRDRRIEYRNPDHVAKHFLLPKWKLALMLPFGLSRVLIEKKAPGSYWFSTTRTMFGDETVRVGLSEGARQLVIFGAGADSRAVRFRSELRDATVFELDWPGTQRMKRQRVARFSSDSGQRIEYIPTDLNGSAWIEALAERGYDPSKPTVFLAEGLLYYLARESVERIMSFVARNTARGTYLACDFSTRRFLEGDCSTYGGAELRAWLDGIGEQYVFGIERADLSPYAQRHGLELVLVKGPAEVDQVGERTREMMLGNFFYARMSPMRGAEASS